MMAKAMSKMSINKEMISDNSDANIADMLIQGLTMGNLKLTKHIDNYEKTTDKKIINLAKSLRKFGKEYIENCENDIQTIQQERDAAVDQINRVINEYNDFVTYGY